MTNRHGLNRSLGSLVGLIGLVALLSSGAALTTLYQLNAAIMTGGQSARVLRTLDAFRTAMLNQETGLRGYLLTGRETSLEPYDLGRLALEDAIAILRSIIPQSSPEEASLTQAEAAARRWQTDIGDVVVREALDPATRVHARELEANGEGKRLFDQFRERLNAIQTQEEHVLDDENRVLRAAERNATVALVLGALITLAICGGVGLAINRFVVKPLVALAEAMRRLSQQDLRVPVPETHRSSEVGGMARAVEVFKQGLIELDRTSLLRATADTLPAMVGYVDAARRIGFLNNEFARWFDLRKDVAELRGRTLAEVFPANSFPGAQEELESALAGQETRFEHRLARRGGGRRDVEAVYRPHRAPGGPVLGVVTLLTDISERKEMERSLAQNARELSRSNEELEQFAYVASHDLKAPLRGIQNLVSWIEEDLEGSLVGDTRVNMDLLKSRVRRLESLLDDLLAYSRAGRREEGADAVDTRDLVQDLALLVSPPEGFSIVADPSLPTLRTARAPLTQMFQNLIGNAIKHHDRPAEGHVWVAAKTRTGLVEFTVTDDGPGIPEQFRDRVFGMFQTLRPRDEVEGSGMGLAIVRKLVDRRGGDVWLTETRAGRGLAVHVTWPDGAMGTQDGTDG